MSLTLTEMLLKSTKTYNAAVIMNTRIDTNIDDNNDLCIPWLIKHSGYFQPLQLNKLNQIDRKCLMYTRQNQEGD